MGENELVRVAMVQAMTDKKSPAANVENAVRYLEKAAVQGANIVCLPETYPGPWTPPLTYDALPALCGAAKEYGLWVIAGVIEPVSGAEDRYHIKEVFIDADGQVAGEYRRTTPRGPWIYQGSSFWDFHYQEASTIPVFETPWCKIGIAVCSEVYFPEVSRMLALQGAEIIFLPAGIPKEELWPTWRTLIWARAIENLCFTATCQNVFAPRDLGLTMICSPEEVMVESIREGVYTADLDLGRLRFLRQQEDNWEFPGVKHCKPGIWKHWYRPELHAGQLAQIAEQAAEAGRIGGEE